MHRNFPALAILLCLPLCSLVAEEREADVVIYGGTSSGVAAAVQVARMGKTVILLEPEKHIGGLTTGGLGWTDSGNKNVIGGIAREFYQHVKKHYDQPNAWKYEKASDYGRYRPEDDAMWTFEPHVAEKIMHELIGDAKVRLVMEERLDRGKSGVMTRGGKILSFRTLNSKGELSGNVYKAKIYIDATYEGDLLAAAGVSYTVGRESNDKYNETLNGVAKKYNTHNHRFKVKVDPYVVPGDPKSGILPGVHGDPPGEEGAGDHRVQAYCYRMCMSNVERNRVPFPKPENYDELRYELLLRNFEAGDLRLPLKPDMMPNGKTDTNNNCAFSTDNLGMNYDYPEASYERRQEILQEHEAYQKGLMWTLANHNRVPESIRKKMSVWGLAADEFTDNGNWPHQIYVREARRMVSDYVMTERDCRRIREANDSIGMGSYNMDSHNTQRYITKEGFVQNEGDVQVSPGGAYKISYRSIIPRKKEAQNLLVPVCLSSSHIAYGSIRMEPVFMILGQSAATAACMSIDKKIAVQEVPYDELKKRLIADKQVLEYTGGNSSKGIDPKSLSGIVIDDFQAKKIGAWPTSASVSGFVGSSYIHDGDEEKGKKSVVFSVKVPKAGKYQINLAYTPNPNRATNVPVTIQVNGILASRKVNQRKPPSIKKCMTSLGVFALKANSAVTVTVSNEGTDGHVVADAIQMIAAE